MRKYWGLVSVSVQSLLTYRVSFICSVLGDLVKTFVALSVWLAVFSERKTIANFDFVTMITYIIVSQTLNNVYSFHNAAERSITTKIYQGTIGFELIRPVDFVFARFAENIGQTFAQGIFSMLVFVAFNLFVPELLLPNGIMSAFLFLISAGIGYIIMFTVSLMSGLFAFWFENSWGLRMAKNTVISFLSGALVPLTILPPWLEMIANIMPFKNIIYTPCLIYLGYYNVRESMLQILIQIAWAVALLILTKLVFAAALKKIRINGG